MIFTLNIKCDNAAFTDESGDDWARAHEVARILRLVADKLDYEGSDDLDTPLRDLNGNTVGYARFEDVEVK